MFIFLDESGSFVAAPNLDSWNVIVAYLMPEIDEDRTRQALAYLHTVMSVPECQEIKLKDINEDLYFEFLARLAKCHGRLFAVATDSGLNKDSDVERNREVQARKILINEGRMLYDEGRQAVRNLADKVRRLSPQLYVQLRCQIVLADLVVRHGSLYFVQRLPSELGRFAWRIDQKNDKKTVYERTFRTLTPALLQTMTIRNPMVMLEGANYTAFKRYDFSEDETPPHAEEIDIDSDGFTNIQRLVGEDFEYVDSSGNYGVQIADLLASGLRRCLRRYFDDNQKAAQLLGKLMVRVKVKEPPIGLLGFSEEEEQSVANDEVVDLIETMGRSARSVLC